MKDRGTVGVIAAFMILGILLWGSRPKPNVELGGAGQAPPPQKEKVEPTYKVAYSASDDNKTYAIQKVTDPDNSAGVTVWYRAGTVSDGDFSPLYFPNTNYGLNTGQLETSLVVGTGNVQPGDSIGIFTI